MELLRILAMFLVLLIHSVFLQDGFPSPSEVVDAPLPRFTDLFLFGGAAVCVDTFVLISGWFGIHPSKKSFSALVFMVIFYFFVGNLIGLANGTVPTDSKTLFNMATLSTEYWFVYAYIGLYLLAPVLNTYIDHTSPENLRKTLLFFYLLQTWYGWFRPQEAAFFMGGYSTLSFIGLYLLARYLRLYFPYRRIIPAKAFMGYGLMTFVIATIAFLSLYLNIGTTLIHLHFQYISPLVILSAVLLLLGFAQLRLSDHPWINRLGTSAFAVYLIHTHNGIYGYMHDAVEALQHLQLFYPLYLVALLTLLSLIYLFCTALDQIRIRIWQSLQKRFITGPTPER